MKMNSLQVDRFMDLVAMQPMITKDIDYSIQSLGLVQIVDNKETSLSKKGEELLNANSVYQAAKKYNSDYMF